MDLTVSNNKNIINNCNHSLIDVTFVKEAHIESVKNKQIASY